MAGRTDMPTAVPPPPGRLHVKRGREFLRAFAKCIARWVAVFLVVLCTAAFVGSLGLWWRSRWVAWDLEWARLGGPYVEMHGGITMRVATQSACAIPLTITCIDSLRIPAYAAEAPFDEPFTWAIGTGSGGSVLGVHWYSVAMWRVPAGSPNALDAPVIIPPTAFPGVVYDFPPYYPSIIFAPPTAIGVLWLARRWLRNARAAWRVRHGLCRICAYDLRAHKSGQRCPECGTPIPAEDATMKPSSRSTP